MAGLARPASRDPASIVGRAAALPLESFKRRLCRPLKGTHDAPTVIAKNRRKPAPVLGLSGIPKTGKNLDFGIPVN